jgi:hypothetical protein
VIALLAGSLIIKSKQLDQFEEHVEDDVKMMMDAFDFPIKSTAKNYKYFYRGQYSVMPEPEDVVAGMKTKKLHL